MSRVKLRPDAHSSVRRHLAKAGLEEGDDVLFEFMCGPICQGSLQANPGAGERGRLLTEALYRLEEAGLAHSRTEHSELAGRDVLIFYADGV
jgi:hypothetical protein